MRRINIILIALTVSVNGIYAQSYTEIFDSIFSNISRTDATTGILYDRVIPISSLQQFSGIHPDTASNKLPYNTFNFKNIII